MKAHCNTGLWLIYVAYLNCYKHYLFLFYKIEGVYVFTWWPCFLTFPVSRGLSSLPQQSPWAKKWTNRVYCLATPLTDLSSEYFTYLGANWARTGDGPQNWETKNNNIFIFGCHQHIVLNIMRSHAKFMTESLLIGSPKKILNTFGKFIKVTPGSTFRTVSKCYILWHTKDLSSRKWPPTCNYELVYTGAKAKATSLQMGL